MMELDPKLSMWINIWIAMLGVIVASTAALTTIFGNATAQIVVAVAGIALAALGAVNGVLHGYAAPGAGPLVGPPQR
jgi:hypothetical protein